MDNFKKENEDEKNTTGSRVAEIVVYILATLGFICIFLEGAGIDVSSLIIEWALKR